MSPRRVVVVPSALALLPAYAGVEDPLAKLRETAAAAVGWLVGQNPHGQTPDGVQVLTSPVREDNRQRGVTESAGWRVGAALLRAGGLPEDAVRAFEPADPADRLLVVANGSATRSERAPGHLDERAFAFDAGLAEALRGGEASALAALDETLARDLWCHDATAWRSLGQTSALAPAAGAVQVDYDDDPFGVQYWVMRWTCAS